jgi:Flp pilus assembly protein TadD
MARLHFPFIFAPLLTMAACAGTPPPTLPVATEAAPPADSSPYGLFLAGQEAVNRGQGEAAAGFFDRAASVVGGGETKVLSVRAFTAALLAGDVSKAASLAPLDPGSPPALRRLGALVRGVEALAKGDNKSARAILITPAADPGHELGAALLAPWAAAAAGDAEASIARPTISGDPVSQFFADLDQGKLFERARRFDESETSFRALIAKGDPGRLASLNLGEMLERRSRGREAVAIYDQALRVSPNNEAILRARTRAASGAKPPPIETVRQGASEALIAPASEVLADRQPQVALAYLRLALRLDPGKDEAWLLVGDILAAAGDASGARAAFLNPKPGSPQYVTARGKLAWNEQARGDKESALKIARETLAAEPKDRDAAVTLADLLRADERFADSAQILDGVILDEGAAVDWRMLYMRAVDYEQSDRWPDAEHDLKTALALAPEEPELLNFLGYSWIDRGENLPQALAMVQKAVSLDPKSGAMIDSLGWGYFKLGQFGPAVEKLEAAVVLEPADPDVNNHLGDAYWRVGRTIEARFQWQRVLSLSPTEKLRREVEAKLKSGLTPAASSAVIAHQ